MTYTGFSPRLAPNPKWKFHPRYGTFQVSIIVVFCLCINLLGLINYDNNGGLEKRRRFVIILPAHLHLS
jgi:hypothetical protein